MNARSLDAAVRAATLTLTEAGVPSARHDAQALAAHLLGVDPGQVLTLLLTGAAEPDGYAELVAQRAMRIPLQHLTGTSWFAGIELAVGPGVFVPRPETELLVELGVAAAAGLAEPLIVDLGTGSGAVALAVADQLPSAVVHAVEVDPSAHAWAARNVERVPAGERVTLHLADLADLRDVLGDLAGRVDLVVSNPPYVPPGQVPRDPEVRDHDPHLALFGGGEDGLAIPRQVASTAAWLLRPGGVLAMEHAESQDVAMAGWLRRQGWDDVTGHRDLTGRPRCTRAARRAAATAPLRRDGGSAGAST